MLLEAYGKFEPVVYDTQGPRYDGSDIILRYRSQSSIEEPELICFQAKSFEDLEQKSYMQVLKAQRDDSFRKVHGMRHYFLLLCSDAQEHKERVRSIMAEFRSAERTEVIEPAFAFTFLHHPRTCVEALVKRAMESEDIAIRLALDSLELPSPSARALVVFLAIRFVLTGESGFTMDELVSHSVLRDIYAELQNRQEELIQEATEDDEPVLLADFETQLAEDLALMETDVVEMQPGTQTFRLRTTNVRPLYAVVADALVRYGQRN